MKSAKSIKAYLRRLSPAVYFKIRNIVDKYRVFKFKQRHPETKIFIRPSRSFYSQEGQDYIVFSEFFSDKKNGVFCDVGANHPKKMNNTRHFEEIGWSGFAFEPIPYMGRLWERDRAAIFFPFAASDKDGEITLSVVKSISGWEDMLSHVKGTEDTNKTDIYDSEDFLVKTRRLDGVFTENNIKHIDYMPIDVEGHELNVLNGIDFHKVRINVLTIENNPAHCKIYGDNEIREVMLKNNYVFYGRIFGMDGIYVQKDYLNTLTKHSG